MGFSRKSTDSRSNSDGKAQSSNNHGAISGNKGKVASASRSNRKGTASAGNTDGGEDGAFVWNNTRRASPCR